MFRKILAAIMVLASPQIWAVPVSEGPDAGNTILGANRLFANTTSVNGTLGNDQDADLFRFTLDANSTFTIEVLEIDPALDMNLLVFNSSGQALAGDDDNNSACTPVTTLGSLDSCLTLALVAGDYFFAVGDNNISAFVNTTAFNTATNFFSNDDGIRIAPTLEMLGLVGAQGGPADLHDVGRYLVNFSQPLGGGPAPPVPIPSLSNWGLVLLAALLGVIGLRRRGWSWGYN